MTWVKEKNERHKRHRQEKSYVSLSIDEQILTLHISPKGARMKPDGTDSGKDSWMEDFTWNDPEEHAGYPTSDSA